MHSTGLAPVSRIEERQTGEHWHLLSMSEEACVVPAAVMLTWVMAGGDDGHDMFRHLCCSLCQFCLRAQLSHAFSTGRGGSGLSFDRLITRRDCFVCRPTAFPLHPLPLPLHVLYYIQPLTRLGSCCCTPLHTINSSGAIPEII